MDHLKPIGCKENGIERDLEGIESVHRCVGVSMGLDLRRGGREFRGELTGILFYDLYAENLEAGGLRNLANNEVKSM